MDEKIRKRVIIKHRNEIAEDIYMCLGLILIAIGLINISNINFSLFLFGGVFVLLIKQRRKIWFEDYIEFNSNVIYLRFRNSHVKKIKFKHIDSVVFTKNFFAITIKGNQTLFDTKNIFVDDLEKIKQIFQSRTYVRREDENLKGLKRFYS